MRRIWVTLREIRWLVVVALFLCVLAILVGTLATGAIVLPVVVALIGSAVVLALVDR